MQTQFSRKMRVVCATHETASQRYARAAKKYNPGPLHVGGMGLQLSMYTRPNLMQDLESFDIKEQMVNYTAAAAQHPQLYTKKLADDRQKMQTEDQFRDWHEIL